MACGRWMVGASAVLGWLSGCGSLLGDVNLEQEQAGALALSGAGAPSSGGAFPAGTAGGGAAGSAGVAGSPATGAAPGSSGTSGSNPGFALCDPGQARCQDARLERCGADARWQLLDACATPALCELARAGGESACVLPACAAGERRCDGNRVLVCNSAQTELVEEQLCAPLERCDPRRGCDPLPCTPGERRCNGARIEVCDAQAGDFIASGEPECASAQLCSESGGTAAASDARCLEPVCPAGEFRCVGALLQRCGDGRNAWLDFEPCASAELCDASLGPRGCQPPVCEAGALSCAGQTLQRCRPGGDGSDVVAECAQAGGCDARTLACGDPCIVGGARCSGAFLETCEDLLSGWQRSECASAALCDAATRSCLAPSCAPTARRCRGAQPQRCAPGREGFVDVGQACASAALCDPEAGACLEPACAPGETRCENLTELLTCNAEQTGFDSEECEGLLALCDPGPPAQCRSLL